MSGIGDLSSDQLRRVMAILSVVDLSNDQHGRVMAILSGVGVGDLSNDQLGRVMAIYDTSNPGAVAAAVSLVLQNPNAAFGPKVGAEEKEDARKGPAAATDTAANEQGTPPVNPTKAGLLQEKEKHGRDDNDKITYHNSSAEITAARARTIGAFAATGKSGSTSPNNTGKRAAAAVPCPAATRTATQSAGTKSKNAEPLLQLASAKSQQVPHALPLPPALALEIFSYLDVRTLVKVKAVCNEWNQLANQAIDAKAPNPVQPFQDKEELAKAIKNYTGLEDYETGWEEPKPEEQEKIAQTYGWPIGKWNVSKVTDMSHMFSDAITFNQDISGWDVSKVNNMYCMFCGATTFNQDISSWNTKNVTKMDAMFNFAEAFNQDISGWDVSNVTNMSFMFRKAKTFNQDISGWDVSKVNNMCCMFCNAKAFDQDISGWDVSNVTDMRRIFSNATTFNQDISSWNTRNVIRRFNQDISSWNTRNVIRRKNVFTGAKALDQNNQPRFGDK